MKATIVYWYAGSDIRPDGGGLRIRAWESALESLGYETEVVPLWTIGGGVRKGSALSSIKRSMLPMPFKRDIPPQALEADLVVATVPAVFDDALRKISHERLVLDWMDLWSDAASNVGKARWSSRPGGAIQSRQWKVREQRWAATSVRSAFAGYADLEALGLAASSRALWMPTPIAANNEPRPHRDSAQLKRLGFIGNLDYPPNRISLKEFLDEYLSDIASNGIEVVIAGFGSEDVREWGYRVEVMGAIDDTREFYDQVDGVIVPIRHGSGIKVKAVEALCLGVPVFATEHVRSGFSPEFRHLLSDVESLRSEGCIEYARKSIPDSTSRVVHRFSQEAFAASASSLLAR